MELTFEKSHKISEIHKITSFKVIHNMYDVLLLHFLLPNSRSGSDSPALKRSNLVLGLFCILIFYRDFTQLQPQ